MKALGVAAGAEGSGGQPEHLGDHLDRIAGIGTDHQGAAHVQHLGLQLLAPQLFHRVEDVVGIGHHRQETAGSAELVQHIGIGRQLAVAAPAGDGGMLCRRDGEAGHGLAIIFIGGQQGLHRVGALEIDQMGHAAQRRTFPRGGAARPEIVQLEIQRLHRRVGGALPELAQGPLDRPRHRRHGGGVPHRPLQAGFQIGGQPERLGIGIDQLDHRIAERHHMTLGDGADLHRQTAAVMIEDPAPPLLVERHAMGAEHRRRFGDGRRRDRSLRQPFQIGLQAEEHRSGQVEAAVVGPRLHIGGHVAGALGILPFVAGLVAVDRQDGSVGQTHDAASSLNASAIIASLPISAGR